MAAARIERIIPWGGVLAALGWILGNAAPTPDSPGATGALERLEDGTTLLLVAQEGYAIMAVGLLALSVAIRARLRAGESDESSYSGLAHAGLLLAAAAVLARLALVQVAAAAASDGDAAVVHVWSYLDFYAWWPILIGVASAMLSAGVGGLRTSQLPRWFARTSVALGALGLLGALNVPPGGAVIYLLLPLWLVGATVVLLRGAPTPAPSAAAAP
ncbi:MAG: hypothetical protein WBB52_01760 [Acidimicrobiales bacterium]|jgi:hypothetical protein